MIDIEKPEEFICPLDVGMHGDITQFLIKDCKSVQEAKELLEKLGYIVEIKNHDTPGRQTN